MSCEPLAMVPEGWAKPPPDLLAGARDRALEALRSGGLHPVQERLEVFYDTDGDYAGATFAQLEPIESADLTPSDLLATTLLSVQIGPRATRRILHPGPTRDGLLRKLADVSDVELGSAGVPELLAMAAFYEARQGGLVSGHGDEPQRLGDRQQTVRQEEAAPVPCPRPASVRPPGSVRFQELPGGLAGVKEPDEGSGDHHNDRRDGQ
jgi:hypothetical protein